MITKQGENVAPTAIQYPPQGVGQVNPGETNEVLKTMRTMQDQFKNQLEEMERKRKEEEYQKRIHDLEMEKNDVKLKNLENLINTGNQISMTRGAGNTNMMMMMQQQQQQQQQQGGGREVIVVEKEVEKFDDGRLKYSYGMYCLFVLLNLCLPGVGSILAGILYGKTSSRGDRTGNVICHGIAQLIFAITIFGWVWGLRDALNYFAYNTCPMCGCFD
jgi:hypothetical protein